MDQQPTPQTGITLKQFADRFCREDQMPAEPEPHDGGAALRRRIGRLNLEDALLRGKPSKPIVVWSARESVAVQCLYHFALGTIVGLLPAAGWALLTHYL